MASSGIYRQFEGSYTPIIFQMQAQAEKALPSSEAISVTCEICYCNYQPAEGDELRPAGICYRCWLQHIRTFISQISYRVGSEVISPFQGKEPIDVCLALKSLLPSDEAELEEFLFKKYCAFTADIEKCPSEACDYVFMMEACRWGKGEAEQCPKCQVLLTQAAGFDLKSLVGFVYFLFLTNKCPKCQIPIEKTTGCPHMSCPCGHQFCWYCLKDYYPAANNVYSVHEPRECAAIFISKVIFIGICIAGIFLTLLGNQVFQRFMGYFFTGMAYIVHTLLLDLAIALNIFAINSLLVRHYNRSLLTIHKGNKIVIGSIIFCDLVVLLILYWLELLIESAVILLVEATLAGVVALTAWLVIINIETWFKYIC